MNCTFLFDWDSFWINIISESVFFVVGILISIWLIPIYTIRLIRKKNKKFLINKIGAILQELCDFLSESPFRDNKILNFEMIAVFTKKSNRGKISKDYKFVALCGINVLNKIVFPQMAIVIYDYYNDKNPDEKYTSISDEYNRLKKFRLEIERIIAVHSLHVDDSIIQKSSNLCFDIKALEIKFKANLLNDELLEKLGENRKGIFGLNELTKIYETLLYLIKDLVSLDYFELEIEKQK